MGIQLTNQTKYKMMLPTHVCKQTSLVSFTNLTVFKQRSHVYGTGAQQLCPELMDCVALTDGGICQALVLCSASAQPYCTSRQHPPYVQYSLESTQRRRVP